MKTRTMNTRHSTLVTGLLIGIPGSSVGPTVATTAFESPSTDATVLPPAETSGGTRGIGPFASTLTDEQQTDMWALITSLTEENATPAELKAAIQHKLSEFGVLDAWLSSEITQTEQQLAKLTRQKELRDEGYSWADIRAIIQDECGCQHSSCIDQGLTNDVGFHHGPCGGSDGFIPPEESTQ